MVSAPQYITCTSPHLRGDENSEKREELAAALLLVRARVGDPSCEENMVGGGSGGGACGISVSPAPGAPAECAEPLPTRGHYERGSLKVVVLVATFQGLQTVCNWMVAGATSWTGPDKAAKQMKGE